MLYSFILSHQIVISNNNITYKHVIWERKGQFWNKHRCY